MTPAAKPASTRPSVLRRTRILSSVGVLALGAGAALLAPLPAGAAVRVNASPRASDPFTVSDYLATQRAGYGSVRTASAKYEAAMAAAAKIEAQPAAATAGSLATAPWTALGPTAMTGGYGKNNNSGFYGGPNSGRVDSLAVSASGEIFDGSAGGGVWGSTDDGEIWSPLTDHVHTGLAIGALATDPDDASVVYAGTGEDNECGDCFYGGGILKSTDAGRHWSVQNPHAVFTGVDFDSLVVDPNDDQVLYAGTSAGLYVSRDGGADWAHPSAAHVTSEAWGIALDPNTSPTTVYAAASGVGIERSVDGGRHFAVIGTGLPAAAEFGFTALGIGTASSAHPDGDKTIYAAVQLAGTQLDPNGSDLSLYRSTDGGSSWSLLTEPAYTNQAYAYGGGSADQAFYDNTLAVDPADPQHVLAGGIALIETRDGGGSWTNVDGHNFFATNSNVLHPDQHALVFDGGSVLIGNDGGVYDASSPQVSNLNSTLDTGQFYQDLGVYGDGSEILGGLQDNGTALYDGQNQWPQVIAGDGGYNAINPLDPAQQFGEADAELFSTADSWQSHPQFIEPKAVYSGPRPPEPGGPDPYIPANFVPAMTIVANPSDVDAPTLYFGAINLYVTTNPGARNPTYKKITNHPGSFVASISVAPSDPDVVYVGFDDGTLLMSTDATAADPTFTDISPGIALWITHIAVDPTNPRSIAVSFSDSNTQYTKVPPMVVTGTVGAGAAPTATYTDITGNLPKGVASNSVVFDHGSLVVATDVGTFLTSSPDGAGTAWSSAGVGLPNVQVIGLTEDSDGNLYAATHGRGVWKLTLSP